MVAQTPPLVQKAPAETFFRIDTPVWAMYDKNVISKTIL
jgi:hypothetical protein